jgi:hypothetical protein
MIEHGFGWLGSLTNRRRGTTRDWKGLDTSEIKAALGVILRYTIRQ